MSEYWIFKVKDHIRGSRVLSGRQIFEHRMEDKAWGIDEFQENGRRTANTKYLDSGQKVIFYSCDKKKPCFLGDAVLGSKYGVPLKSVFHEEFMDLLKGVAFEKVNPWKKELPIERLRGKVHFVPIGKNFGSYIQGSVTRISGKDYQTIMREHNQ